MSAERAQPQRVARRAQPQRDVKTDPARDGNTPSEVIGRHLLADIDGVAPDKLRDPAGCRTVLDTALAATGHTVLDVTSHTFPGGGFTTVYLLAESHLSLHTYPERGYLAFDLFSCSAADPHRVLDHLTAFLGDVDVSARVEERRSQVPAEEV